jgi:hypothetical protein
LEFSDEYLNLRDQDVSQCAMRDDQNSNHFLPPYENLLTFDYPRNLKFFCGKLIISFMQPGIETMFSLRESSKLLIH